MKTFNLLPMRNSQKINVDNFQRNAGGGHLVFQNEANFLPRERYPVNFVNLADVVFLLER